MKTKIFAIIFTVLLTAFTVFITLDTFVIPRGYQVNVNASDMFAQITATTTETPAQDKAADDNTLPQKDTGESDASLQEEEDDYAGTAMINESAEDSDTSNLKTNKISDDNPERTASVVADQRSLMGSSRTGGSSSGESSGSSRGDSSSGGSNGSESLDITSQSADVYTYQDDNISISISQYTVNGSTVYAADVQLSSAEYLKTAFANNSYGRNFTEKTSSIASANNAILAVNGDYYGARERGYVIRNGVVYRNTVSDSDVLCIYVDGTMEIVDPSKTTTQDLVNKGVWQAFSFGPALVQNGEISISTDEEVGMSMSSNPRTAIGIIDPLHYVFVVSDGRTDSSEGLSLYILAGFMQSLGAKTAYNLDGGGSSTMVFQGKVINHPTTTGNSIKEREVSDIVYIG